jgi:hypothetical protein
MLVTLATAALALDLVTAAAEVTSLSLRLVATAFPSNLSAPAVTVIAYVPISVESYVSVLLPGKFASLPPAVSLHTAFESTQSIVAVKSVLGSLMSMLYVEGPKTTVCAGKRPQSVFGMQATATVVAVGLAETMERRMSASNSWASEPMPSQGTDIVVVCAVARESSTERMSADTMIANFGMLGIRQDILGNDCVFFL